MMEKMKLLCLARMVKGSPLSLQVIKILDGIDNCNDMHLKACAKPTFVKTIGPIGRAYNLDAGTFSKTSSLNHAHISRLTGTL
jgi:hypothetical protein